MNCRDVLAALDFTVKTHLRYLLALQERLESGEELSFHTARFLIEARKPRVGAVTVQTRCDMDSFALWQGESPHLNLPPRGEEAELPPLDSEHILGAG